MLHRHLDAPGYTLAAIDDVIERGMLDDWMDLAQAVRDDPDVKAKVAASSRLEPVNNRRSTMRFGARDSRISMNTTPDARRGVAAV